MQRMGLDCRTILYPLLFDVGMSLKHFGKINSPYQIPTFQSAKINKYEGSYFISLSVFPFPYISALNRTQEYISPYIGIGYQSSKLSSYAFNYYDYGYYRLNLSSSYWKVGCNIFLGDFAPFDLFIEYAHTLNPDKIRNYEWLRIGVTFRYSDLLFKEVKESGSISNKFYSIPLIYPE